MSSSPPTATPVAAAVEKPPRKFPPPCWTQEETLCLIDIYRERWYALRRGYLRTADWDAVAAAVSSRYPDVTPAKTSAQCRHKMEKLRQRYRAEKQRALSYPYPAGRYFSSWFFFDYMEAMENETDPPSVLQNSTDGSRLKTFLDDNIVKLKLKSKNGADPDPNFCFDNSKSKRSKISSDYSPYLRMQNTGEEDDDDEENLPTFSRVNPVNVIPTPPLRSKPKNPGKLFNNFDNPNPSGFHSQMLPPGLRVKKMNPDYNNYNRASNSNEGFWAQDTKPNPNYWANSNPGTNTNGPKRGRNELDDIVTSIKLLGEGFVKIEKAKMELAREIETTRMEMEMKRNEMLLESQKQIVEVFLKGLIEMKANKKVKSGVETDSAAAANNNV